MSYSAGEALILSLVQSCSNFDSTNSSRCNWKLLNQGKSDHYAILRPGAFSVEWITVDTYLAHYTTVIELWQRYKDDSATQTNLYARVADLLTGIQPAHRLDDDDNTVSDASVSGSGEVTEMWKKGGGPAWLKWELNLSWSEEIQVTFTD